MPDRNPFVPIGHPRLSQPTDSSEHRVGLHLLEALDSLDAVYGSAAFFAGVAAESALGDYTLDRCLDAIQREQGAIYLAEGGELRLHADRNGAAQLLSAEVCAPGTAPDRATFTPAAEARRLLRPGAPNLHVLTCPIHTGSTRLGLVVVLGAADHLFSTGDVKLVAAVTSQAAIAISRAHHHRQVEIERRKLEQVIENHSDGVLVLDADGRTTLCNPIARELLAGACVLRVLGAPDGAAGLPPLPPTADEREFPLTVDGQLRVLGISAREVRTPTGELANVILTMRDLTRRRREDRLKRDFLSLISHKFRTPLTALICGLEIVQGADDADREVFLGEVGQRTRDLQVLVDRLLYFTELLEGSWSTAGTTDLGELAGEIEGHFHAVDDRARPQVVWDLAADARTVPAPASRLRVALLNLVDNALKFGSPAEPWVRIGSRRTPDGITIEVEDRGPGIPPSARERLFEMFQQLDEDFTGGVEGAGIGLAMVREIASRLGGRLDLRDAEPHGCIFSLTFPLPEARP